MSGTNYCSPISKSPPALWLPEVVLLALVHKDLGDAIFLLFLSPCSLQEMFESQDGDFQFLVTRLPYSLNKHYLCHFHANSQHGSNVIKCFKDSYALLRLSVAFVLTMRYDGNCQM